MTDLPSVSIIIPHYNGKEMLRKCLISLTSSDYDNFRIVLVDNASSDGSAEMVEAEFPEIQVIRNEQNLGFAGGCNVGIRASYSSDYIILFNNDALPEARWLSLLVDEMESEPMIAAAQPKILSVADRELFDYSGAAGGLMDEYGYPYARGRIIGTIERDEGQYDQPADIFWASGTACIIRTSVLDEVGLLDESFFAHMEEIDLNWRLHLRGYRVRFVPEAVVRHQSGATLSAEKYRKKYLNHRNSIIMMLKNYTFLSLLRLLPVRIFIDLTAFVFSLLVLDFRRAAGITAAFGWIVMHPLKIIRSRKEVQALRTVDDGEILKMLTSGSIAIGYYLKGRKKASQIPDA